MRDSWRKHHGYGTWGTYHAKMGSIKNRNRMHLTETEDIKKGGKNTQKNYTKTFSQLR